MKNWIIRQPDVKNAFMNEVLEEIVYMEQPPRSVNPEALHNLKQVSRAWYDQLPIYFIDLGFVCSNID